MSNTPHSAIPLYQWYSIYLATVEVALGAVLHGARIPLTGYILSLHQAFCLSRAVRHDRGLFTPISVSATVALLKTLSPAGKKITPMIAILAQGIFFNLGLFCLGNTLAGHLLGAVLLSFWGFIQPTLFAYVIFGQDLLAGFMALEAIIRQYIPGFSIVMVVLAILSLKAILAMGAVALANSSFALEPWIKSKLSNNPELMTHYLNRKEGSFLSSLARDLTNTWFLFSYAVLIVLCWWRQDPLSQGLVTMMGYLGQSILLFAALRFVNPQKIIPVLERWGLYKVASSLHSAFLTTTDDKLEQHP